MKIKRCKDCEAFKFTSETCFNIYKHCLPKSFLNINTGEYDKEELYREDENADGNCKYYKRKWWKFWV